MKENCPKCLGCFHKERWDIAIILDVRPDAMPNVTFVTILESFPGNSKASCKTQLPEEVNYLESADILTYRCGLAAD